MDKLHLDQHISQQYNADLEDLRTELLEMGGMVEEQVRDAITAISNADGELAERVLVVEDEVDQREIALDEHCTLILARRQPAASDLRMVMAVSKITRDLERMGDEAQKVARMAIALVEDGSGSQGYVELRHLGNSVQTMVHQMLDAFARFDVETAMNVAKEDKQVDREYRSATRELMTYMMEDPRSISRVMNVMWALRSLERIGDHARNIAEHIIYLVKGLDVRHTSMKEIEKQLRERP
ncbi:phosphate signaling complex protein PhoU [Marinibactrum halimedae]|uniref:Phosphate-specific transport system accessory protein PhoU n=2 Tax=Marinibactrum halimedae TaxID=1444977 RepID=A0AA37TDJ7_9GAMM|nr:phosphate signaling complex protein PhoU [Marinibactrum halimedae]MCD9459976.1 phosphate signaling complex protein PhoU [Marinibactrum halimedae]GLS28256.1 phosphate transport system regulatory protein PhoU [Marinibactrum halimedae]